MTHIRDQLEEFLVQRGVPLEQYRPAPPNDAVRTFGVTPATDYLDEHTAWIVTYDEQANLGRQYRDSLALLKLYNQWSTSGPPTWRWTATLRRHPVSLVYYWNVEELPQWMINP